MAVANEVEQFPQVTSLLPDMPRAANLKSVEPAAQSATEDERNPIFEAW